MTTIGQAFDPSKNSLNAIRLFMAATVIVSHSWLVSGLGAPPMLTGTDPGLVAVASFFAISGYLVTASRVRARSLWTYLWRRFLRIYPGFIAALVVVALVFAPVSTLLTPANSLDWASAIRYVLANAGLFINQTTIDSTLTTNAFPFIWNIPLWTLFYEALCYLLVGIVVSFVPRRALGAVLAALLILCTAVSLAFRVAPGMLAMPILDHATSLASFFLAGAVMYLYRDSVPSSGLLAALAVVLAVAFAGLGLFEPLAAVLVAYVMLYAGSRLPLSRVGRRNDVSYGMYVYGFPVQQLIVLAMGGSALLPVWAFAIVSVALTIPLAWVSWLCVEKPALRLRRRDLSGRLSEPLSSAGPA